jgi:hypothetical protein
LLSSSIRVGGASSRAPLAQGKPFTPHRCLEGQVRQHKPKRSSTYERRSRT